jgi:hypothetical protein
MQPHINPSKAGWPFPQEESVRNVVHQTG